VRLSAPKITVTCDCGEVRRVDYGEQYTCTCGRTWSTASIPAEDYGRIQALDRRYRLVGWIAGLAFASLLLFVILTKPQQLFILTPGAMALWFGGIRPFIRRRHWREIQALTRQWNLRPENGASA
jgi:hypothetical protein